MSMARRRLEILKSTVKRDKGGDTRAQQTPKAHLESAHNCLRLAMLHLLAAENFHDAERVDELIKLLEKPDRDLMH